jgi:pyruvate dehydrogenase E2 component (dihydrolipoamide acetyltransferase)
MGDNTALPGGTQLRFDRFRRVTERRMTASVTEKPQVTLHRHASLGTLDAALAEAVARTGATDITMTALLLKLVASTMAEHGRVNGWVKDKVITMPGEVHLGIAVDVGGSLVVPTVRHADRLSVAGIGREVRRLAAAARESRLRPEDVDGATFTVTSLGSLGVELFTPIINPPQLAILGVGAVTEHVVLRQGVPATERRLGLSLTFDHAATDGADAARVLGHLVSRVEDPWDVRWSDAKSDAESDVDRPTPVPTAAT